MEYPPVARNIRILRGGTQSVSFSKRPGASRRLHVRRIISRCDGTGFIIRIRWDRISGRVHCRLDHDHADRRRAGQKLRQVHALRRRRPSFAQPRRSSGYIGLIAAYFISLPARALVGGGALASLLLPIGTNAAILLIGVLMIAYVLFGGMVAATYVQIVKAVLVWTAGAVLVLLALAHFSFDMGALFNKARLSSLHPAQYFLPAATSRIRSIRCRSRSLWCWVRQACRMS